MTRFPWLFLSFMIALQGSLSSQGVDVELPHSDPVAMGYKPGFFQKLGKEALKEVPSLGSLLVWRKEGIVFEEYFNGANESTRFMVKSVTKSVVSALAGIAMDNKLMPDLRAPVFDLFPEYATDFTQSNTIWFPEFIRDTDAFKRKISLHDLLSMQTGYLWEEQNMLSIRAFHASSDPVRFVLDLPFEAEPGTTFRYCTGASHVLGVAVSKCMKMNLWEFADSMLFKPIGIHASFWSTDPQGRTAGGTELSLKARDMLKFGLLYLNEGIANGKQVISKSWVAASTSVQAELNEWDVLPGANGYGYCWWRRVTNGHQAFVASGTGGQLICIVPDLEMVVVTTCWMNALNRGRSEIKRLHGVIDGIVAGAG